MSDERVELDLFAPGFVENPYPHMARLRDLDPVHVTPFGPVYVSRHDDVSALLKNPAMSVDSSNAASSPLDAVYDEVLGDDADALRGSGSMLDRDPPDHTRLRRLVSKAFTPRRISELRPRIQGLVDARLDKVALSGDFEVISDLAFPLPFEVISDMLGMPDTDRDRVREVSGSLVRNLEPVIDPEVIRAINQAQHDMVELITAVIDWKRSNPGDDLLTLLIEAEHEGDRLDDEELLFQVVLLFVAGHETTVNLIGNGLLALTDNPSQLESLRDDPDLIENAIEEMLRYDSPVQMTRRIPLDAVVVGGRTITPGTFVLLSLASANRDEAHFGPTAAELDLARDNARDHVAFGGGAHFCLGAALARLEAQIAIGSVVERFGSLRRSGDVVYNGRINLRGLEHLPMTVSA